MTRTKRSAIAGVVVAGVVLAGCGGRQLASSPAVSDGATPPTTIPVTVSTTSATTAPAVSADQQNKLLAIEAPLAAAVAAAPAGYPGVPISVYQPLQLAALKAQVALEQVNWTGAAVAAAASFESSLADLSSARSGSAVGLDILSANISDQTLRTVLHIPTPTSGVLNPAPPP